MLRFGTDGIRGVAGRELTPELVMALGRACAAVLGVPGRPVLVGRDTRWSGPMLQAAFSAGVAAAGLDVVDLGVLPTPAVASESLATGAPAAVISASHNPYGDNGIKLLAPGGRKLTDAQEQAVEAALGDAGPLSPERLLVGDRIGRLSTDPSAAARYGQRVVAALDGRRLSGLRVVIDCGHGASVATARTILEDAGAVVVEVLGDQPDGRNINAGCGSTDPSGLSAAVRRHGAAAGLAFDGDADRVIAVDDQGSVVDGDRLLALFATDLHARRLLAGAGVVVTVMTNLGFHQAMAGTGIHVGQTPVGDRNVMDRLESDDWSLGGEQSGHIIFRGLFAGLAPTGDGVLTGLLLLDVLQRRGVSLSSLAAAAMVRLPQTLRNVAVGGPAAAAASASAVSSVSRGSLADSLAGAERVWAEVRAVEAELGATGRVLLRASGTEPLVRVMVEAPTEEDAARLAERLSRVVVEVLGPGRPATGDRRLAAGGGIEP